MLVALGCGRRAIGNLCNLLAFGFFQSLTLVGTEAAAAPLSLRPHAFAGDREAQVGGSIGGSGGKGLELHLAPLLGHGPEAD